LRQSTTVASVASRPVFSFLFRRGSAGINCIPATVQLLVHTRFFYAQLTARAGVVVVAHSYARLGLAIQVALAICQFSRNQPKQQLGQLRGWQQHGSTTTPNEI
jgi:hypothetical protein